MAGSGLRPAAPAPLPPCDERGYRHASMTTGRGPQFSVALRADNGADDLLEALARLGFEGARGIEGGESAVAVQAGLVAGVLAGAAALQELNDLGRVLR